MRSQPLSYAQAAIGPSTTRPPPAADGHARGGREGGRSGGLAAGRNHTFTCPHCGIVAGRDDVGARGNLLAAYGKAVGILADGTSNQ